MWQPGQAWEYQHNGGAWTDCVWEPKWTANIDYRLKPQTRRQHLIAAGVPADELAKIVVDNRLDQTSQNTEAYMMILESFLWLDSPQGRLYWEAWHKKLLGQDVTIPVPEDSAKELYCVIFSGTRICFEGGEAVSTMVKCQKNAEVLSALNPQNTYTVMRLTPA
jgi:hypothetical protein